MTNANIARHFPDSLRQDDLILRPPVPDDTGAILDQLSDPRVARWLAALPPEVDEKTVAALMLSGDDTNQVLRIVQWQGKAVGGLSLGPSLWYWISPTHWRQGIARNALSLALKAWFSGQVPPVYATSHVDNAASQKVLAASGFSRLPMSRRMFFQGTGQSERCHDFVLAPEQWHLLHPPELQTGSTSLAPATQKDVGVLSRLLERAPADVWPTVEGLQPFVERHRFRGPRQGVFKILDANTRVVGLVLAVENGVRFRFLTSDDEARHLGDATTILEAWRSGETQPASRG